MRAALTLLAILGLALAGATSVRAADTLGGTLAAGGNVVVVKSTSTVPVLVTLEGDYVTVTPATFNLDPGESQRATMTGPAKGDLRALLEPVITGGVDQTAAQLVVHLTPAPVPATDWTPVLGGLLAVLLVILALWRIKPWQYRLARR